MNPNRFGLNAPACDAWDVRTDVPAIVDAYVSIASTEGLDECKRVCMDAGWCEAVQHRPDESVCVFKPKHSGPIQERGGSHDGVETYVKGCERPKAAPTPPPHANCYRGYYDTTGVSGDVFYKAFARSQGLDKAGCERICSEDAKCDAFFYSEKDSECAFVEAASIEALETNIGTSDVRGRYKCVPQSSASAEEQQAEYEQEQAERAVVDKEKQFDAAVAQIDRDSDLRVVRMRTQVDDMRAQLERQRGALREANANHHSSAKRVTDMLQRFVDGETSALKERDFDQMVNQETVGRETARKLRDQEEAMRANVESTAQLADSMAAMRAPLAERTKVVQASAIVRERVSQEREKAEETMYIASSKDVVNSANKEVVEKDAELRALFRNEYAVAVAHRNEELREIEDAYNTNAQEVAEMQERLKRNDKVYMRELHAYEAAHKRLSAANHKVRASMKVGDRTVMLRAIDERMSANNQLTIATAPFEAAKKDWLNMKNLLQLKLDEGIEIGMRYKNVRDMAEKEFALRAARAVAAKTRAAQEEARAREDAARAHAYAVRMQETVQETKEHRIEAEKAALAAGESSPGASFPVQMYTKDEEEAKRSAAEAAEIVLRANRKVQVAQQELARIENDVSKEDFVIKQQVNDVNRTRNVVNSALTKLERLMPVVTKCPPDATFELVASHTNSSRGRMIQSKDKSVDECKELCANAKWCTGFTTNIYGRNCDLHTDEDALVGANTENYYRKVCPQENAEESARVERHVCENGYDELAYAHADKYDAATYDHMFVDVEAQRPYDVCEALCEDAGSCVGFTINRRGECYLFNREQLRRNVDAKVDAEGNRTFVKCKPSLYDEFERKEEDRPPEDPSPPPEDPSPPPEDPSPPPEDCDETTMWEISKTTRFDRPYIGIKYLANPDQVEQCRDICEGEWCTGFNVVDDKVCEFSDHIKGKSPDSTNDATKALSWRKLCDMPNVDEDAPPSLHTRCDDSGYVYSLGENVDINAHDGYLFVSHREEDETIAAFERRCKGICDRNARCAGFTFMQESGECYFGSKDTLRKEPVYTPSMTTSGARAYAKCSIQKDPPDVGIQPVPDPSDPPSVPDPPLVCNADNTWDANSRMLFAYPYLGTSRGNEVHECKDICQRIPSCEGFNYLGATATCQYVEHHERKNAERDPDVSYERVCKDHSNRTPKYDYRPHDRCGSHGYVKESGVTNVELEGGYYMEVLPLTQHTNDDSIRRCRDICDQDGGCFGFTESNGACYLVGEQALMIPPKRSADAVAYTKCTRRDVELPRTMRMASTADRFRDRPVQCPPHEHRKTAEDPHSECESCGDGMYTNRANNSEGLDHERCLPLEDGMVRNDDDYGARRNDGFLLPRTMRLDWFDYDKRVQCPPHQHRKDHQDSHSECEPCGDGMYTNRENNDGLRYEECLSLEDGMVRNVGDYGARRTDRSQPPTDLPRTMRVDTAGGVVQCPPHQHRGAPEDPYSECVACPEGMYTNREELVHIHQQGVEYGECLTLLNGMVRNDTGYGAVDVWVDDPPKEDREKDPRIPRTMRTGVAGIVSQCPPHQHRKDESDPYSECAPCPEGMYTNRENDDGMRYEVCLSLEDGMMRNADDYGARLIDDRDPTRAPTALPRTMYIDTGELLQCPPHQHRKDPQDPSSACEPCPQDMYTNRENNIGVRFEECLLLQEGAVRNADDYGFSNARTPDDPSPPSWFPRTMRMDTSGGAIQCPPHQHRKDPQDPSSACEPCPQDMYTNRENNIGVRFEECLLLQEGAVRNADDYGFSNARTEHPPTTFPRTMRMDTSGRAIQCPPHEHRWDDEDPYSACAPCPEGTYTNAASNAEGLDYKRCLPLEDGTERAGHDTYGARKASVSLEPEHCVSEWVPYETGHSGSNVYKRVEKARGRDGIPCEDVGRIGLMTRPPRDPIEPSSDVHYRGFVHHVDAHDKWHGTKLEIVGNEHHSGDLSTMVRSVDECIDLCQEHDACRSITFATNRGRVASCPNNACPYNCMMFNQPLDPSKFALSGRAKRENFERIMMTKADLDAPPEARYGCDYGEERWEPMEDARFKGPVIAIKDGATELDCKRVCGDTEWCTGFTMGVSNTCALFDSEVERHESGKTSHVRRCHARNGERPVFDNVGICDPSGYNRAYHQVNLDLNDPSSARMRFERPNHIESMDEYCRQRCDQDTNCREFTLIRPRENYIKRPGDTNHEPDMRGPDMRGPDMRGPDMGIPGMRGPDMGIPGMRGSDMRGPDMGIPDMRGPDMNDPDMRGPDMRGPDMNDPDMRGPDMGATCVVKEANPLFAMDTVDAHPWWHPEDLMNHTFVSYNRCR